MDEIDYCDERSKALLQCVKSTADRISNEISTFHKDVMERSDRSSLTDDDSAEISIGDEGSADVKTAASKPTDPSHQGGENFRRPTTRHMSTLGELETVREMDVDVGTPTELQFRQKLSDSSTPKPVARARGAVKRNLDAGMRLDAASSRFSDDLVSLESRPSRFVCSTKESDTIELDLQQVETVLPDKRCHFRAADSEAGETDDTQSHTVYNIAKLVAELNAEKKKNSALTSKLELCETELAAAKVELELEKAKEKERNASHVSNLVEEVYKAQKEREAAMLARLKFAVQERDEALLRAKASAKDSRITVEDQNRFLHDKSLHALVNAVRHAETRRAAEKLGREVVDHVESLKRERARITHDEMRAVMRERDDALRKCRVLGTEVAQLKHKPSSSEDQPRDKLKLLQLEANLALATEERDKAKSKLTKVEDEMETLRLHFSLQTSVRRSGDGKMMLGGGGSPRDAEDAQRLVEALRVAHEHTRVQDSNSQHQMAQIAKLSEKNDRLERLVNVLRNKLALLAEQVVSS